MVDHPREAAAEAMSRGMERDATDINPSKLSQSRRNAKLMQNGVFEYRAWIGEDYRSLGSLRRSKDA